MKSEIKVSLFIINMDMGCNCSKDSTPLTVKQKLRRDFKKKVSEIKQMWNETSDHNIISTKDQLGFKPKE